MGLMLHHLDVLVHVAGDDVEVSIFHHAGLVVLMLGEF